MLVQCKILKLDLISHRRYQCNSDSLDSVVLDNERRHFVFFYGDAQLTYFRIIHISYFDLFFI